MFDDMKQHIHDWKDEEEIGAYLTALLNKEAFDHAGLIYGMAMLYILCLTHVQNCSVPLWNVFPKKRDAKMNLLSILL